MLRGRGKQTNMTSLTTPIPTWLLVGVLLHKMATGGYSYDFAEIPPDDTVCHICTLVSRDPQQVKCCFKIYCKSCLLTLKEMNPEFSCPTCRGPLRGKYFKDGRAEQGIKSLNIYCTNSDIGCQWVGPIRDIDGHIKNDCLSERVYCPNKCGQKVLRGSLEVHMTGSCTKYFVNCQYCKRKGRYQLINSSHLDECPDLPIQCSSEGCHEMIPRHSLASHNEICPKAIVLCQYNTVGCNKRIKREEQEEHNDEALKEHLEATMKKIDTAMKKIEILRQTNQVIKLNQYKEKKDRNEDWYGPGFYTSPGGYKMSLNVLPNGQGKTKGSHISFFVCLMAGEYDDSLEWPFQGEVTVELLNQLEDENHKKITICYNESTEDPCKQRVQSQHCSAKGWGRRRFISHDELEYNPAANCQYLKDDSLYFRVSVKSKVESAIHFYCNP